MTKIVAIASGKGGVGKTTIAINLGTALAGFKRNAIVVDGNLETPNVGIYLGAPVVPNNVHDAVNKRKGIKECVYMHPSGVRIAPGSISLADFKNTDHSSFKESLKELDGTSEIIIVDSASGLGKGTFSALESADEVIIVTTPDLPSVTDSIKSISLLEEKGITVIGTVLNRVTGDGFEMSSAEVEAMLEVPVIASIPEDECVRKSLMKKNPVVYSHPDSNVAIAYKELAALLIGQKYEDLTKGK